MAQSNNGDIELLTRLSDVRKGFTGSEINSKSAKDGSPPATPDVVDSDGAVDTVAAPAMPPKMSQIRTVSLIVILAGINFLSTLVSGILVVALPRIATDLKLPHSLLLWPASVYALACACTLLICGSIADVVGSRVVYLIGCSLFMTFTLACGLSKTGIQLILFRAFQGIAMSLCLPSSVSIVTNTFPSGKMRNICFACMGAGQPLGFSVGLILGGIFVNSIGWAWGYYLSAIVAGILLVGAMAGLPRSTLSTGSISWKRLGTEIDWMGGLIAGTSLGLLSYVFAMTTAGSKRFLEPVNLALFCIAIVLLPLFIFWVGRQERSGKPAIIPNSLWRNIGFTSICVSVFLAWAAFNAMQYFGTLFFQEVQQQTALATSIRFLPMVVSGALTNILTGYLVNKTPAHWLVLVSFVVSAVAPLLMAVINPEWPYWSAAFVAMLLSPIAADVLFTVSNLVITNSFPSNKQGLAGGVFNTISQVGNSVGLAITAVISSSVSQKVSGSGPPTPTDLMTGYRATFWTLFGGTVLACVVSALGLRRVGKVGMKRD